VVFISFFFPNEALRPPLYQQHLGDPMIGDAPFLAAAIHLT
jgi:hypothetical protein